MNAFAIFAAFAAGVVLDATYQHIRKENEYLAFRDGYKQAQKEEAMRTEACAQGKMDAQIALRASVYTTDIEPRYVPKPGAVTDQFMDDLHRNGRAVVRIK